MKILFIASDLNKIGGIQRYNKIFLQNIIELGENTKLVELKGSGLISKFKFIANAILKSLIFRPDVIICAHINFSPICYFLKKFFGFEYTITVYGIETANIKNKLHYKALKSTKFIINLFEQTADNIIRQIPESEEKIILVPNSVNGDKFFIKEKSADLINRYNLNGFKIIVTACRLVKADRGTKCYDKVIQALPVVLERASDIKYLLVGEGDDLEEMKKLANDLNLGENIIFVGAPSNKEMIDYYNLADVFVLISQKEGFPAIVHLEALSCGKPVVCGEQPGREKDLFQKEFGIVVDSNNKKNIAEAIINVLTGKAPKHLYDQNLLRKRVLENYGPEACKKNVENLLKRLRKSD